MKNRVFIGISILLPAIFLIVLILVREKPSAIVDLHPAYVQALAQWRTCEFIPIAGRNSVQSAIRDLPVSGDELPAELISHLHEAAYNLLIAFHEPSPENYKRFRLPTEKFAIDMEALHSPQRGWVSHYLDSQKASPEDPMDVFWLALATRIKTEENTGQYWREVCMDQSLIRTETLLSAPASRLTEDLLGEVNAGIIEFGSTFTFIASPARILEEHGKLHTAVVSFVIQTVHHDPSFPVACRFYWDPDASLWLPIHLAAQFVGPLVTLPIF